MRSYYVSCYALIHGKHRPNYTLVVPPKVFAAYDDVDATEACLDELLYDQRYTQPLDNAYLIQAITREM